MPLSEPPYERERFIIGPSMLRLPARGGLGISKATCRHQDLCLSQRAGADRARRCDPQYVDQLTLDDGFEIKAIEAVTDDARFDLRGIPQLPKHRRIESPAAGCATSSSGWAACMAALVELLGPMATVAFQRSIRAGSGWRARRAAVRGVKTRPRIINSCHALSSDGPVVKDHWPQWYTGTEWDRAFARLRLSGRRPSGDTLRDQSRGPGIGQQKNADRAGQAVPAVALMHAGCRYRECSCVHARTPGQDVPEHRLQLDAGAAFADPNVLADQCASCRFLSTRICISLPDACFVICAASLVILNLLISQCWVV